MASNYHDLHGDAMIARRIQPAFDRMEDMRREIETIRILKEAGIHTPGLFERAAMVVGIGLVNLGQYLQRKYAKPPTAQPVTSHKLTV
jgi:hypothetical protein